MLLFPLTLAAVLAGWALTEPKPITQASTVTATTQVPTEELCRQYAAHALVMADHLDHLFRQYARDYEFGRQGKMAFGPPERPGTVLFILEQRRMHASHYHEFRDAYRKTCLT
jgi:hypothetical protein